MLRQLELFDNSDVDVMLYNNGRDKPSWRCECGCNVFRKIRESGNIRIYKCNSCGGLVEGVKI